MSAVTSSQASTTPLVINHTSSFPSVTLSFNLATNMSLSDATRMVSEMQDRLNVPRTILSFFAGTASAYQTSLSSEPLLIGTALLAVYIVLGILYESLIHPLTIISTLPSASVGAMLALMLFKIDLNVISIIGIILLIGIVKKNAIMMIDFALVAEREQGMSTADAIFEACKLRFRPILMTTMAALFGALPLAFGSGTGSELRRPLGITIAGGLIVSQMLTLYTTPVVLPALRQHAHPLQQETVQCLATGSRRSFLARGFDGGSVMNGRTRYGQGAVAQTAMFAVALAAMLTGCNVGPKYTPPATTAPALYKESPEHFKETGGWKVAQPSDAMLRGEWWEIYNDPGLNALEEQLNIDNQNIRQAFENFMEARALVREGAVAILPHRERRRRLHTFEGHRPILPLARVQA